MVAALAVATSWGLGPDEPAGPPLRAFWRFPAVPLEAPPPPAELDEEACAAPHTLAVPSGDAPALSCDQARRIVAQARTMLAMPSEPIDLPRFAAATSDWLDPHGLWSVAPDAPIGDELDARAKALLAELEAPPGAGACSSAEAIGATLGAWVGELRGVMGHARSLGRASVLEPRRRWDLASGTPFEDGTVSRRARDLARLLGHSAGALERAYGEGLEPFANAGLDRMAPERPDEFWTGVVLAAAVRAYVPQIDPHGAWAPLDEETSIYDLALEVDPPPRLWAEMTRTTLGIRLDRGARAPLRDGDVLLRLGATPLAGLSVEQANQLAYVTTTAPVRALVLRSGSAQPLELEVAPNLELLTPPPDGPAPDTLTAKRVAYGDASALVVRIPDVPDDLGDRVAEAIRRAREESEPVGVLLDLRGNGGGSTDGALGALGVFLPGATLFPMKRRDGEIEIDRAPRFDASDEWKGPVAALVDGDSASAAEMVAGAIAAYDRGPVLGARTYGKGCAQEYLDDEAGVGVLRLTTLVFALPDGAPLQRVGVAPDIALGLPPPIDREALLPHAPYPWRGPDVRDRTLIQPVPWPTSGGRIGSADDVTIHRALRALGAARAAAR